jgi:hypothetical protein
MNTGFGLEVCSLYSSAALLACVLLLHLLHPWALAGSAVLTAASFSRHSRTGTGPCLRSQRLTLSMAPNPVVYQRKQLHIFSGNITAITYPDGCGAAAGSNPTAHPCMSRYRTNAHWQARCTPFPPTRAPPTMVQRPPVLSLSALSHNFLFQASSSSLAACKRFASKDKSTNTSSLRFAHCLPPQESGIKRPFAFPLFWVRCRISVKGEITPVACILKSI